MRAVRPDTWDTEWRPRGKSPPTPMIDCSNCQGDGRKRTDHLMIRGYFSHSGRWLSWNRRSCISIYEDGLCARKRVTGDGGCAVVIREPGPVGGRRILIKTGQEWNVMYQRIITCCALSLCVAVGLAACGDTSHGQPPSPDGHGTGSAEAARPVLPSAAPPTSGDPSPVPCPDGAHLAVDPAQPPAPICLRAGHVLHLSTTASPLQPWENFTSSAAEVVTCESTRTGDGAVQATCTAQTPGTSVITSQTTPFSGDPHGPAQLMWQLTITVTT